MSKKSQRERAEQIRSMAGIGPALAAKASISAAMPTPKIRKPFRINHTALAVTLTVIVAAVIAHAFI